MKNKQNEYNAPKTIKDWQKLLNSYVDIVQDYPNIPELDKIMLHIKIIKEKIKNMQQKFKIKLDGPCQDCQKRPSDWYDDKDDCNGCPFTEEDESVD